MPGALQWQFSGSATDFSRVSETEYTGEAHLVQRSQGWMFGAFAGDDNFMHGNAWNVGVEGALYFRRATLAASLAYENDDDLDTEGEMLLTEARYFVSRNFRLDGIFDYARTSSAGVDADGAIYGVGGEYRVPSTPFSVFARYTHANITDVNTDIDTGLLGLRYNFDKDLAARDEQGASLLSVPNLGSLF